MRTGALAMSILVLVASGCFGGGSSLEARLKTGVARAYGPIDSVSCKKSDGRKLPTGEPLHDCTIHFASGEVARWCAVEARGVAAWDRTPCRKSSLARAGLRGFSGMAS